MMPYVDRNQGGGITCVYACQQYDGQEFVEDAQVPQPALTKEQHIAVLLAPTGQTRLMIQTVIAVVELQAPALAAQYGVSLEIALATLYAKNKSYRVCKDLEAAIRIVETAP